MFFMHNNSLLVSGFKGEDGVTIYDIRFTNRCEAELGGAIYDIRFMIYDLKTSKGLKVFVKECFFLSTMNNGIFKKPLSNFRLRMEYRMLIFDVNDNNYVRCRNFQ